jgi:CelD/BcsL family acetyltransferase involved in cellulose biosynthesis
VPYLGGSVKTSVRYSDLGAIVYPANIPDGIADELPALYNTLLSTVDWFETHDRSTPAGACILERPRHVLLFCLAKDTVEILNKEFAIAPGDVERACRALFRTFPQTRRIHVEVLFPPEELRLPKRVLYGADHMVVDLPTTVDAYTASLGKGTRRQVRRSRRDIEKERGPIAVETMSPGVEVDELISTLVSWKNLRFNAKGETTLWQADPTAAGHFAELVRRRGRARIASIAGTRVAIQFLFPVGTSMYVAQSGFDPEFSPYGLGLLQDYDNVCEAIEEGFTRLSLFWGTTAHKAHLGARPKRATRVSVFRSRAARVYSLDEAREVAARDLRRAGQRYYWQARHAAGRALRAARSGRHDDHGKPRGARE